VAELKRAHGDLDGHSVLIATNGKELAALRTLGERNYFEFKITKFKAAFEGGRCHGAAQENGSEEEPVYNRSDRRR